MIPSVVISEVQGLAQRRKSELEKAQAEATKAQAAAVAAQKLAEAKKKELEEIVAFLQEHDEENDYKYLLEL